uniref:Oxidoreductase FAD/NAD(P)-binding domain-containing protein n=1 Tax=Cryptomonas curvata TaxID=233186 RepID=A0A7S0R024_9CRYP
MLLRPLADLMTLERHARYIIFRNCRPRPSLPSAAASAAADFAAAAAPAAAGRVDYWVCGPTGFMAAVVHGLVLGCGVPRARIHYEAFGPAMDLCPAEAAK